MDVIGVVGLIVSVGGFWLALWQLGRTKKAAEAAQDAAREAVRSVQFVQRVATIQDICGRSRDLLHLTRARNNAAAATAAFELRDALSKFQIADSGKALVEPKAWQEMLSTVGVIHERLESAALSQRFDISARESLIHEIAKLHTHLSSLAAKATNSGGASANT